MGCLIVAIVLLVAMGQLVQGDAMSFALCVIAAVGIGYLFRSIRF